MLVCSWPSWMVVREDQLWMKECQFSAIWKMNVDCQRRASNISPMNWAFSRCNSLCHFDFSILNFREGKIKIAKCARTLNQKSKIPHLTQAVWLLFFHRILFFFCFFFCSFSIWTNGKAPAVFSVDRCSIEILAIVQVWFCFYWMVIEPIPWIFYTLVTPATCSFFCHRTWIHFLWRQVKTLGYFSTHRLS